VCRTGLTKGLTPDFALPRLVGSAIKTAAVAKAREDRAMADAMAGMERDAFQALLYGNFEQAAQIYKEAIDVGPATTKLYTRHAQVLAYNDEDEGTCSPAADGLICSMGGGVSMESRSFGGIGNGSASHM